MIHALRKTLAVGVTALIALGTAIVVGPGAALAAERPAADWAFSAPWATTAPGGPWAQPCNGTLTINLNGDRCGTDKVGDWGGLGTDLVGFAQAARLSGSTVQSDASLARPDLGLGCYAQPGSEGCFLSQGQWPSWDTFGYAGVINRTAVGTPSSMTVDVRGALASLGFTGDFYVHGADVATGVGSARITRSNGGEVAGTAVAVTGGVRIDFPGAAYAGSPGWTRAWVEVVGLRADGSRALVRVLQNTVAVGSGSAQSLALTTPVNVPLDIALTDLQFAVSPTAAQVIVDELPATVTRGEAAFTFVSAAPTVDTFAFRGAFQVEGGWLESPSGTVTITATDAAVEPEVIVAPTVRDFAFPAPLAAGVPVDVDVIALTEGEGFNAADWTLEASDAVAWSARGGVLTLTPEGDREALTTSVRWRSLIDPTVTSNWGSITAPAAEVVTPEPEPTPNPEVTPTPDPTPAPEVTPAPETTPESLPPTPPPGGAETGDEGLTLLGYGLALLLGTAVAFTTRSRRFARR